MSIYQKLFLQQKKSFAVLIDPDKTDSEQAITLLSTVNTINEISCLLVGGSLVSNNTTSEIISNLRKNTSKPVILFPGNVNQICPADAILFLSLISGRNPEYLIGQHVAGAPVIKKLGVESISTSYMLVGDPSSTSYISNTTPLPGTKSDLIVATAQAGEMLGHSIIYMDAGSGASSPISPVVISAVSNNIQAPLVIGGGICTYDQAKMALDAGARTIVIGNAVEHNSEILFEIASAVADVNRKLKVH